MKIHVVGVARCSVCDRLIEGLVEGDGHVRLSVHGNPAFPLLGGHQACIGSHHAFEPAEDAA